MITILLRTGVHIIAPKRPRALRICPSTTWAPMKNMVGRQYRAKATVTAIRSGSEAMSGDIMCTRSGAASTHIAVTLARMTTTRVSKRLAYASPPSSSFFMDRTSCGTKTAFNAPPPTRT